MPQDLEKLTFEPDANQSFLLDVLCGASEDLGEIYRGILHALHSPPFPNQSRVLAYQAREVMVKAPKVMSTYGATVPARPMGFAELRKQLGAEYANLMCELKHTPAETALGREKLFAFLDFVESWLLKAEQTGSDYERLTRSRIAGLEPGSAPPRGRALEIAVRRWISMKKEFNDILHGGEQAALVHVRALVSELEDFFLLRIRPRPFDDQAQLDQFLARSPDDLDGSEIEAMLGLVGALGVNYRYFFQHLDSPLWVGFLEKQGFFKNPPELLRIEDQIYAPEWPELLYLERITPAALHDAGRIARGISRFRPENPRIHERLIAIAKLLLQEGSKHGGKLLNSELDWIAIQDRLLLRIPDFLLEAALAAASEIPGLALRSIRSLLSLEVADEVRRARSGKGWHRLDDWDLREILKRVSCDLVGALPAPSQMHLLTVLCEFLGLVGENEFESTDLRMIDNVFLMWRPAIEDHEQNDLNSLSNWAVEGVRNVADALIEEHGVSVLEELEGSDSRTLLRVSLFLRTKHPDIDPAGTADLVEDPQLLGDNVLRHEFFNLLREQFTSFTKETQNRYLKWAMGIGNPHRRQLYLWPVHHALPKSMLEKYQSHEQEFGEPEHPDLPAHHGVSWVGPTSPFSVSEMKELQIPKLVDLLNSWEYAPGHWHAPEPEGLARELAAFASQDAKRVSGQAIALENLQRPTCVRGIAQGLADAVKEGRAISWEPVLHFCTWAVRQERGDEPEGSGFEEFDRTWGPARKQIARLLGRGTEKSAVEIPFDLRGDVWAILRELLLDPDPTEEEERSRAEHTDPSTIAINVVRGVALGATFSYALWVTRHDPQEERTWARFSLGDVRELLEERLAEDQSLAVRSVFGKWLPYLFWLDQKWTEANVKLILPLEEAGKWTAAWHAYLMFCRTLYSEFLELLHSSYERALDELGAVQPDQMRPANPDERLGNHLLLFYREEALELDDALLKGFFEKADANLRYSVMADVVRQIQEVAKENRETVVERLRDLWEWRSHETLDEKAEEHHELSSFGWWFLKDVFPPEWRLQQLLATQQNDIELQLGSRVLETMIELSEEYVALVLNCLEAIVRSPANGEWIIYDDHVKEILRIALGSDDKALLDQAENLVHYIGSLGFLSFRDLLEA